MRRTATPREGRQVSVKRAWSSLASLASSYKIYLAFVALVVSFTVASPVFVSPGNVLNIGRQTALVSIIAVGMTFVIITAEIDLSVASTLALSGMLGAIAMQNFANIWVVGVVVALATGTSIGLVNGVLTTALSIPSFLSSLGMLGVARGIAMMVTDTRPVPITNYEYVTIFGAGSVLSIPVPIVWTIVVIAGGTIGLHFLSFGRRVFATGGNANAARYSGIDTKRVKIKGSRESFSQPAPKLLAPTLRRVLSLTSSPRSFSEERAYSAVAGPSWARFLAV
jgi:ribose/xylose/arabinose/galactoside ABC-type transport system permease subunit